MKTVYKPPLKISDQLAHIEKNKHVVFNQMSKAEAAEVLEKYGYINVITPFKYLFAKRDPNGLIIKDSNGNHIYERDIDFKEYYDAYLDERRKYPNIYKNITEFEINFNSIVAFACIHHYKITDSEQFNLFISDLQSNIVKNFDGKKREHMFSSVTKFRSKMNDFGSIYIFMDRLTLNEVITIFKNVNSALQTSIFKQLLSLNLTFGNTRISDFEKMLDKLVHIRNYVFHENSLTVLVRYYSIKDKKFRDKQARQSYNKLINKLSVV